MDGAIIKNNFSLTCMIMIDPATRCFEIVEVTTFDINEVMGGNDEYIDKSSARIFQLLNNTGLCKYPRPRKIVFDNWSEHKQYFTLLLKYFGIEHILMTIKTSQANAPLDWIHQVILNTIVTKYIENKIVNYRYPLGESLAYIAWVIRDSYHNTIQSTPGQYVFGRDIIFNLASAVDWLVITAGNK